MQTKAYKCVPLDKHIDPEERLLGLFKTCNHPGCGAVILGESQVVSHGMYMRQFHVKKSKFFRRMKPPLTESSYQDNKFAC